MSIKDDVKLILEHNEGKVFEFTEEKEKFRASYKYWIEGGKMFVEERGWSAYAGDFVRSYECDPIMAKKVLLDHLDELNKE